MNLIYGKLSKKELDQRNPNDPFLELNGKYYRLRELVCTSLGANYQAEEVEPPSRLETASLSDSSEASLSDSSGTDKLDNSATPPVVLVPPAIRTWARSKGLLPPNRKGPSYLPPEVREAYEREFGLEALIQVIGRESKEARRIYFAEGFKHLNAQTTPRQLYPDPKKEDLENLTPAEIEQVYMRLPRQVSEIRLQKRAALLEAQSPVTEAMVERMRERRAAKQKLLVPTKIEGEKLS